MHDTSTGLPLEPCDKCGQHDELYHNEASGLSYCLACDLASERNDNLREPSGLAPGEFAERIREAREAAAKREAREALKRRSGEQVAQSVERNQPAYVQRLILTHVARHG